MASDISKYLGNKLCQWFAGTNMPSAPADVYVALYDGDPKGAGTEVTTTIRPAGRVVCVFDSIADDGADILITNDATVDFGNADAAADVTHIALCDASSSGNVLCSKAVVGGPLSITTGSLVQFLAGDLTFTVGS